MYICLHVQCNLFIAAKVMQAHKHNIVCCFMRALSWWKLAGALLHKTFRYTDYKIQVAKNRLSEWVNACMSRIHMIRWFLYQFTYYKQKNLSINSFDLIPWVIPVQINTLYELESLTKLGVDVVGCQSGKKVSLFYWNINQWVLKVMLNYSFLSREMMALPRNPLPFKLPFKLLPVKKFVCFLCAQNLW